jgi:hypothetical protein
MGEEGELAMSEVRSSPQESDKWLQTRNRMRVER